MIFDAVKFAAVVVLALILDDFDPPPVSRLGPELAAGPRPSFLVVSMDCVGVYELLSDPSISTPTIDLLRAGSATFPRAHTSAPMCSPSRTCLTGDYGRRHGIGRIVTPNAPNDLAPTETLASVFSSAGYATAAVGKWHLSSGANYPVELAPGLFGFDNWRAIAAFNPAATKPGGTFFDWTRIDDGVASDSLEYMTAAQVEAAVEWIDETSGPFFLWFSFSAAHDPQHEAPPPYYSGPPAITERDKFESSIEALDNRLAVLLAAVDLSSTYVVLWSDNGVPDSVAEDPEQVGKLKQTLYQGGIQTPLFIAGPGIVPGPRRRLVSTVDFFPTLLDLAGVPGSTPDSRSFADTLGGIASTPRREALFAERFGPNFLGGTVPPPSAFTARERAIVSAEGFKLLVEEDLGIETFRALYNLQTDPLELTPLFDPVEESKLQALLDLFP